MWQWADREVWFSPSASTRPRYDSSETPYTREWQDLLRKGETDEAFFMKSSQSGVTEATLNKIRWMPDNMPGNVGYIINSDAKAKRITKIRLSETLNDAADGHLTDDPNDQTLHHIRLKNMEISVSGSGSANAFREIWYRLAVLDEPEDHETQKDGTTSYDNIQGRFTTVEGSLLLVLGKPQYAGGIVHQGWLKGTQEKWLVPCPHCRTRIELLWDFVKFGHCRDLADGWDLERVLEDTYYQCQACGGRINEHQKVEMVRAGKWVPTPEKERERSPDGRLVPREPGVRSFHISDLYSSHKKVSLGNLAKKWLMAFVLQPNQTGQDSFTTEHLGRPIEAREVTFRDEAIYNLRGGLKETGEDGVERTVGFPFSICYEHHEMQAELPIKPILITTTGDRQASCLPYLVFAWDALGAAYLIDYGKCDDEHHFLTLKDREYILPGGAGSMRSFGGLIDSRHNTKEIWAMCLEAQALGWDMHPSRGDGFNSEFRGRNLRLVENAGYTPEGYPVNVYAYYDHGIKCDFYLGKIGRRSEPRLWLPNPVPKSIVTEWTSEKLVLAEVAGRKQQKFVHDKTLGANDLGDCGKKQYAYKQIVTPHIPEWN